MGSTMQNKTLRITAPGPLSTIQDAGRRGFQASGFSPGGAMDLPAARAANLLVGNAMDMAVLEMTMMGITAKFECVVHFALTGADFDAHLNDAPIPAYQAIHARAGDELRCGFAVTGCRGYLAVAGGFAVEPVLGSCSTNLKCGIGGFEGRKLAAGDALPLRWPELPFSRVIDYRMPAPSHVKRNARAGAANITLRAVPGPQESAFTEEGIAQFFGSPYAVTPASDRMGIKLEGAKIETHAGSDIISDGIAAGSVQVPASGQPIVMMADRQTTGGYAKIATVISADIHLLAQARPGDVVRFVSVDVREAQDIARRAAREMKQLEYHFQTLR